MRASTQSRTWGDGSSSRGEEEGDGEKPNGSAGAGNSPKSEGSGGHGSGGEGEKKFFRGRIPQSAVFPEDGSKHMHLYIGTDRRRPERHDVGSALCLQSARFVPAKVEVHRVGRGNAPPACAAPPRSCPTANTGRARTRTGGCSTSP